MKTAEFEVSFHAATPIAAERPLSPLPASDALVNALKKQEESLPPDLRADDLMNADKALFWSSPDAGDTQIPLAGEQEL